MAQGAAPEPALPWAHVLRRLVYRRYRRAKVWLLRHPTPGLSAAFFALLWLADRGLAAVRAEQGNPSAVRAWRRRYRTLVARHPERRFRLVSRAPVAASSDDHRHPRGTLRDNSRHDRFNRTLTRWLAPNGRLSLLDLGCAGGGLVRSFLEEGHEAVGLEGSDAPRRARAGEWGVIPHHLFTCDIVKPFRLLRGAGRPARFDVVTAWEVLEHLRERDLPQLAANIRAHLKPDGVFICSIDTQPDGNPLTGAVYHHTLKPRRWWVRFFLARGFAEVRRHPFAARDMVRGNGLTMKDWDPADGDGLHLVLRRGPGRVGRASCAARTGRLH